MKSFPKLLLILLIVSIPARGQKAMSLSLARSMALENNENLQIASRSVIKAENELKAISAKRLPSVSASATGIYLHDSFQSDLHLPTLVPNPETGELVPNIKLDPGGQPVIGADGNPMFNMYGWLPLELSLHGAYMAGIHVTQPVFAGKRIATGRQMAGLGVEMAGENQRMMVMDAISEADQAYWLYVSVIEKVKLANKSVQFLETLEKRVANAHQAGMVSGNELLRVRASLGRARLSLQEASSGKELARMSLCRITGLPFDTEIVPADTIFPVVPPAIDAEARFLVTQRPEYNLMAKNLELGDKKIEMARAPFLPEVGVRVGYNFTGGIEINGNNLSNRDLSAIATVNIPIFNWGEGAREVSSARVAREIAGLEMERGVELMQLEIEQASLNLKNAYTRVEIARQSLEHAEENLRVSNNEHELGRLLLSDLLMAQLMWQEAYSELIESKAGFRISETNFLRATGRLAPGEP